MWGDAFRGTRACGLSRVTSREKFLSRHTLIGATGDVEASSVNFFGDEGTRLNHTCERSRIVLRRLFRGYRHSRGECVRRCDSCTRAHVESLRYCRTRDAMGRKRCSRGKEKSRCVECTPCPHGKVNIFCAECNPCPHGKVKYDCAECNPCPHGKLKRNCVGCVGCPHGKLKHRCASVRLENE